MYLVTNNVRTIQYTRISQELITDLLKVNVNLLIHDQLTLPQSRHFQQLTILKRELKLKKEEHKVYVLLYHKILQGIFIA